jgi:hypothetical protein
MMLMENHTNNLLFFKLFYRRFRHSKPAATRTFNSNENIAGSSNGTKYSYTGAEVTQPGKSADSPKTGKETDVIRFLSKKVGRFQELQQLKRYYNVSLELESSTRGILLRAPSSPSVASST